MTDPDHSTNSSLLVLLCTYNERENLERLLPMLSQALPQADLLIVDDRSPDGTAEFVREQMPLNDRISLIERERKLGLGTAVLTGFRHAIEYQYEYLLTLDADLSHPPRYIPDLLALKGHADVVIGSRYVDGGGVVGWSLKRRLMSRCINIYTRLLLGLSNKDNSGNFRCYRVARLAELDLSKIRGTGYAFMEEILYRCSQIGCRFEETPIVFENRTVGESKINLGEAILAVWVIFRLFLDRVFRVKVT